MGYDEHLYIKKKKGEGEDKYVVDEYGGYISCDPKEVIGNFFKAITFDPKRNFDDVWDDVWQDTLPEGDKTEYNWTKIDDGIIPIWTSHGPKYAGGLSLTTPEGIRTFLEATSYFKDINPDDIERISIGWNC